MSTNNITHARWIAPASLIVYLVLRLALDGWWRTLTPWASYAFETLFVITVCGFYAKRLKFKLQAQTVLTLMLAPLAAGFSIYKLIVASGLTVPFDFSSLELVFLLLVLAPVLEEFIFRGALWEALVDLVKKPSLVLMGTTILFSAGHLLAFTSVPLEYRPFVLIQALYVIILGLGCGYARIATGSISAAILVHFAFNFGFYFASRMS